MRGSRCGLSQPQSIPFDQPESFQLSPPGALGSVGVTSPITPTTSPCPATLCYPPTKDRPQGRGSGDQYHASRAAPENDVGLPYRSVGAIATNRQSGISDVTCHFTHNPKRDGEYLEHSVKSAGPSARNCAMRATALAPFRQRYDSGTCRPAPLCCPTFENRES